MLGALPSCSQILSEILGKRYDYPHCGKKKKKIHGTKQPNEIIYSNKIIQVLSIKHIIKVQMFSLLLVLFQYVIFFCLKIYFSFFPSEMHTDNGKYVWIVGQK